MHLLAFCLVVIVGHVASGTPQGDKQLKQIRLKMQEIHIDLGILKRNVLHNGLMLNTPRTEDIKECCSGLALQCFSEMLPKLKTSSQSAAISKTKLIKSLQKTTIQRGVNPCSTEDTKKATCPACEAYPHKDSREFVGALETLLQRSSAMIGHRQ